MATRGYVLSTDNPPAITLPSGGKVQDAQARAAIAALIRRLQDLGLVAK